MNQTIESYPKQASYCGVCNKEIGAYDRVVYRRERSGLYTFYCMHCEEEARNLKECKVCQLHRANCKCEKRREKLLERENYGALGGRTNRKKKKTEESKSDTWWTHYQNQLGRR
ncbi:hypothetical protein [Bacillus toyonensis]|uniref:hypothetical protein n=1 Tax=Bacillus toyonensis TaxID=155322 RepID=UPI000BF9C8F2|nr:hypothetical protein [Bacillus toyonensis]PGF05193.1 hypothetical protein COM61_01870 [Bacillus toyonensis]